MKHWNSFLKLLKMLATNLMKISSSHSMLLAPSFLKKVNTKVKMATASLRVTPKK
jgi:heme O synthase-like polyprenyltransferase